MQAIDKMKGLIQQLNQAAYSYYQKDEAIMSDYEYDCLYDELVQMEKSLGVILSDSPTQLVGYEVLSDLPKETHITPMLSLDKTKSMTSLSEFLGPHSGVLSFKLDGLTIVLTYEEGQLHKAVTRGNGTVGEVITNNAKVFEQLPLTIPFKGTLVVRGEAVITYSDFAKINALLPIESQYKNPRNLCSGTVRQLNNAVTKSRHVRFFAFALVYMQDKIFETKHEQIQALQALGFETVPFTVVTQPELETAVEAYKNKVLTNDVASDGLVLTYDDLEFSQGLGQTAKFPKDALAFKWADTLVETILRDVEWQPSRTGLINPVAVFDPVELEGTTVSRASLHNISIIENLKLGLGDTISVYKANMIIPQVGHNLTQSGDLSPPSQCPICSKETAVRTKEAVKVLVCNNSYCPAKQIKALAHFVSRNAMNIDGLSEATLIKCIEQGLLKSFSDIYHLDQHEAVLVQMPGFGEKSYKRLMAAIEASKTVALPNFIYALGILHVGLSNAKVLCQHFKDDLDALLGADAEALVDIHTIGDKVASSVVQALNDTVLRDEINRLRPMLTFKKPVASLAVNQPFKDQVFVITGSLDHYENRQALQKEIEDLGGQVTGSVSKNTDYLINNDIHSNSTKNQKAKGLGVSIITEETYIQMKTD